MPKVEVLKICGSPEYDLLNCSLNLIEENSMYTVWVDGTEVNDDYVYYDEAKRLYLGDCSKNSETNLSQ